MRIKVTNIFSQERTLLNLFRSLIYEISLSVICARVFEGLAEQKAALEIPSVDIQDYQPCLD